MDTRRRHNVVFRLNHSGTHLEKNDKQLMWTKDVYEKKTYGWNIRINLNSSGDRTRTSFISKRFCTIIKNTKTTEIVLMSSSRPASGAIMPQKYTKNIDDVEYAHKSHEIVEHSSLGTEEKTHDAEHQSAACFVWMKRPHVT